MSNKILEYQRAFNLTLSKLKENESVLGVMVHGSMVTGDLWEGSDIDFFVIVDEEIEGIRHIYTENKEIPIHIKLLSKKHFIEISEESIKGGYMHRIFSSSKLVFSKDRDIREVYDRERYFPDIEREKWNMVYLGELLKDINECKKYLTNDSLYTAYTVCIMAIRSFSRLYVNLSGYMINRDVVTMTLGLNATFACYVENLFSRQGNIEETIEELIGYMELEIEKNLKNATSLLLDYLIDIERQVSSEEIKSEILFKDFDISMEEILNILWEKNIIKKGMRKYTLNNKELIEEKVYYI